MLGHKIENLLVPTINYYESNEPNYFPDIYQITDKTSPFENIFEEMKANSKTKLTLKACSKPNCNNPFSSEDNCSICHSCGNKFCEKCIKRCQKCNVIICVSCVEMDYGEFEDIELCPECKSNQKI